VPRIVVNIEEAEKRWPDKAAVADLHDLILLTRNSRDFQSGGPCRVLVPYG